LVLMIVMAYPGSCRQVTTISERLQAEG